MECLGAPDATDAEIVAFARERDFVILTHDLDFGAILAANGGNKPSVVQIRAEFLDPAALSAAVLRALRQLEAELLQGSLVTVEPARMRVTILPLFSND